MYYLTLPSGESMRFATMGDVLHHLNTAWEHGANPYVGKAASMGLEHEGLRFEVIQNGYGKISPAIASNMPAYVLLRSWLDEVMGYATSHAGTIKRPCEMLRDEWGAIQALSSVAYGSYPTFRPVQLNERFNDGSADYGNLSHYFRTTFYARFGYGHNGPGYEGNESNSRHEVHVCHALVRGEPVPEPVISDYVVNGYPSCEFWYREVLSKPFTRGAFQSADQFKALVSLLKEAKQEVTANNVDFYQQLLRALPQGAGRVQVDNVLYKAGILACRPPVALPVLGTPHDGFAEKVRAAIAEWRQKNRLKALGDRDSQTGTTHREYDHIMADIAVQLQHESYDWPNRVALALESKNLPVLLSILDGPSNEATQRVVETECNVKLRNVPAALRRRAIFAIAGFVTDEEYSAEHARLEKLQEARKAEREFESARQKAASIHIVMDGSERMTGAEFVETLVHKGHTEIGTHRSGAASKYYLTHPETKLGYQVQRSNGTLDYARLLLERATV